MTTWRVCLERRRSYDTGGWERPSSLRRRPHRREGGRPLPEPRTRLHGTVGSQRSDARSSVAPEVDDEARNFRARYVQARHALRAPERRPNNAALGQHSGESVVRRQHSVDLTPPVSRRARGRPGRQPGGRWARETVSKTRNSAPPDERTGRKTDPRRARRRCRP